MEEKQEKLGLLVHYKWEFIRRKPDYQRAYNNYSKTTNKQKAKQLAEALFEKYGFYPTDYRKNYDELLTLAETAYSNPFYFTQIGNKNPVSEAILFLWAFHPHHPAAIIDSWSKQELNGQRSNIKYTSYDHDQLRGFAKTKTLRVAINLTYSKEELIDQLTQIVKRYKPMAKTKKTLHRNRIKEYQRYLEVFDLRLKGWDWGRLANKFYKTDFSRDVNYARCKVKRDYKRCEKLIQSGFRQIS